MKTPAFLTLRGAVIALASICFFSVLHAEQNKDSADKKIPKKALEKYDVNKDGKLDDKEMAAWEAAKKERQEAEKKAMLEKYDTNKDGKLDESERKAMIEAKKKAAEEKKAAAEKKKEEKKDKKDK